MIDVFFNNELRLILSKGNSQEELKEQGDAHKVLNDIIDNLQYTELKYKIRDLYFNHKNGEIDYKEIGRLYCELEDLETKEHKEVDYINHINYIKNNPEFHDF